jgi:pyruvate dehydrogenase E2 component (dihydrolipoamide acetyltransferase)
MITPILLPKQGNTVESCIIVEWKKNKGEEVKKGEVVCEIETDKAVFEIESPENGILLETFFNAGDEVPVLTNIAVIGNKGDSYKEFIPDGNHSKLEQIEETIHLENNKDAGLLETNITKQIKTIPLKADTLNGKKGISPRAKNLADKTGISKEEIQGTGPNGRIIERDIVEANKNMEPLSLAANDLIGEEKYRPESGSGIGGRIITTDIKHDKRVPTYSFDKEGIRVVPLKGIRKLIAERMLESLKNSAQLTLNCSADATALLALRKKFKLNNKFQSVTINDLIHYAVVKVLPKHLELNSLLREDQIEYYNKIHLGFAVDTPRGLMVPVIKNAEDLNLLQLSTEANRLALASLSGKISLDELNGGTFTITNLGNLGIESFTPVLNLPQTCILGINTIALKPVNYGNGVEFIPHISFSLTVDHRVIDGAAGARFLQSLAKAVSGIDLAIITEIMRI